MTLTHGGQLAQVASDFKIPASDWLDLSTGIAPFSYPIPDIPPQIWQQLPQYSEKLTKAAKQYYQCQQLLVSNGSQAIIKLLPSLWHTKNLQSNKVYLPFHGYKEHALAWKNANFKIHWYHDQLPDIEQLSNNCVLVIINPNNPTGKLFGKELVAKYQQAINDLNGLLVVDEAFMDVVSPSQSIINDIRQTNTIVLRSFGKFFGLAGIRIGFVIANQSWLDIFSEQLGPWQVNGPAQYIAQHALQDSMWQSQQKTRLYQQRQLLKEMLNLFFGFSATVSISGTTLFQTVRVGHFINAENIYHALCQQGVYVRLTDDRKALRFGIPKPAEMERLSNALSSVLMV